MYMYKYPNLKALSVLFITRQLLSNNATKLNEENRLRNTGRSTTRKIREIPRNTSSRKSHYLNLRVLIRLNRILEITVAPEKPTKTSQLYILYFYK